MRKILGFVALFSIIFIAGAHANNLSVSNVTITSPSTSAGTAQIQFDISWSNSWRNATNYDAAWVFIKYSTDSGSTWGHAILKSSGTTPSGFSTGSGTPIEIVVPSDKKGAFIQRSTAGAGSVSTTSIQFVWDYSANSVSNSATVRVKVFATEMVYIPTASFYLGDGNGSVEAPNAFHVTDNTTIQLTSSQLANFTVDSNSDDDIDTTPITIHPSGSTGITSNSSYPTGYYAFYLMKYEATEGQWVDFFNTLTSAQKTTRDITDATGKNSDSTVDRNTIAWTSGDATTTRSNRPNGYLGWPDIAAYFDWAALRPFTELEFEKAARGTSSTIYGEFAWGTSVRVAAQTISGSENGTETITTSGANVCSSNTTFTGAGSDVSSGPLRAGIFANSSSTRASSGAGYYGNMELSGNLFEIVVSIGRSEGRAFMGTHGDGVLTTTSSYEGNATNTDWPGINATSSRGVTGGTGMGFRGGGWNVSGGLYYYLFTSDRTGAADNSAGLRSSNLSCRGARTAP